MNEIKIIKKENIITKKPSPQLEEEPEEDLTEVEQEFYLASCVWNKGYRE